MERRGVLAWSAATLLVLGVAVGCQKKTDEAAMAADSAAAGMDTTGAMAPAPAPAAPTLSDPQIAMIALVANSADSAKGKLAETKATNPDVKAFATMMVTDHSALNKQATDLAGKLNVTPAPSDVAADMQSKQVDVMNDLQGKSGADFDKAYMDEEVEYHQNVLNALDQTLIPNAQNAELKQLLQTARQGVQGHLDRAKQIQAQLNA